MLYKNRTVQKMRCNVKNKKSNKKTNDFLMICDYPGKKLSGSGRKPVRLYKKLFRAKSKT